MKVKFFATIRDITGCIETDFPFQETAGSLALSLCDRYGEKLRGKLLSPEGNVFHNDVIFLINGRHVVHLGGFDAPLAEDDTVSIFPKTAGG